MENTPIEYLLLGSAARQGYSADTFALGLCFFHLITGHEPYEVHASTIVCPTYLKRRLHETWESKDAKYNPFTVIKEVIDSLEPETNPKENASKDICSAGDVLYDTLYRYMVLFYQPSSFVDAYFDSILNASGKISAAMTAVCDSLGLRSFAVNESPVEMDRRTRFAKTQQTTHEAEKALARSQFEKDRAEWSLWTGTNKLMTR